MTDKISEPMRFDDPQEDVGHNPDVSNNFADVVDRSVSRRGIMQGLMGSAAAVAAGSALGNIVAIEAAEAAVPRAPRSTLRFKELDKGATVSHAVAEGYDAQVLIRWGDPVTADAPAFDANRLNADAQEKQFGYNCDYTAFFPLPMGSNNSNRGILAVNHEYTNTDFMFSGLTEENIMDKVTRDMVEVELAAHGMSFIEVVKENGRWRVARNSRYNRRVSLRSTVFEATGPAAGHARLRTSADPTGRRIVGTINNCAGGHTPWGTVLSAEENFHQYFAGDARGTAEERNYARYGITGRPVYGWWGKNVARFDVKRELNEANRFGWVVEIDPYDPTATPKKRTALGRFKHENAFTMVNKDGRVVVYSGDDERFEYLYKFVTNGRFNPRDRRANMDLLDDGILYVARFNDDKTLEWLPLVFGQGPLTPANGFNSQADVVIEARRAADLLGATSMDRPEDVRVNMVTGVGYLMLTNNSNRTDASGQRPNQRVNAANPRARNSYGHVLAFTAPGGRGRDADHAATRFTWDIPIFCGNQNDGLTQAKYGPGTTDAGAFAAPDNVTFDSKGRMWITSDMGSAWQGLTGRPDGVFAMDTEGPAAYQSKRFFSVPIGAEMCGPTFTADERNLFVAVQHPATDGVPGNFDNPATRWPDFDPNTPPRPSVVVITKKDGGVLGG